MLKLLMFFFFLIHMFNLYSWGILIFQMMMMMVLMSFTKLMNFSFLMDSFFLMDKMSIMMIFLTLWIFVLSIMSSNLVFYSKSFSLYMFNLFLLLWILLMVFLSNNLIYFFFFFESSLLPTFLLILGWGMKNERLQSGMYMLFYTLFGSLPMLLSFVFIFKDNLTYSFFLIKEFNSSMILNIFMFMGFLMKLPMFFFHSWLPKAHVEAPVSGSMILAGVLLKLGGYGMIRFFFMLKKLNLFFSNVLFSISVIGGLLTGFMCFYQTDMKSLVAYSSVSHMSLIICGLTSYNWWGFNGVVMMMISHGFCSSALFCLINFNYERLSSRSLIFNKGFINFSPSMTMWWFLFCSFNMSCPPSLNLISELSLFNSFFSWSKMSYIMIFCIPFITAVYSIGLFSMTQHGAMKKKTCMIKMFKMREFSILALHLYPLIMCFLKLDIFLN